MIYPTDTLEAVRPLSNDERRAIWAAAFYGAGYHHEPEQTAVDLPTNQEKVL